MFDFHTHRAMSMPAELLCNNQLFSIDSENQILTFSGQELKHVSKTALQSLLFLKDWKDCQYKIFKKTQFTDNFSKMKCLLFHTPRATSRPAELLCNHQLFSIDSENKIIICSGQELQACKQNCSA